MFLRYIDFIFAPFRAIYNYANFGFTAGAIAASNAMRQPWAEFADATLFGPLGMTQSSYRHSDFVKRSSHSAMHVRVDGVWKQLYVRNADPEAPALRVPKRVRDVLRIDVYAVSDDGQVERLAD